MNKEQIQDYIQENQVPIRKSDIEPSLALLKNKGFSLVSILGNGGQGIVFEALKKKTNEKVAIKISLVVDYKKSEIEIDFCKKCGNSFFFPKFYEHFYNENQELRYLIQQYCHAGDLKNNLQTNPQLPEQEKIRLFIQILQGINALHELGIIHADLKPENILISDQNNALITDFGASLVRKQSKSLQSVAILSMAYCPPEQDFLKVVMESDFYSAGAILFYLLGNITDLQLIQIKSEIYPPREQYENKELYDIALSMMTTNPKSRLTPKQVIPKLRSLIIKDTQKDSLPILFNYDEEEESSILNSTISEGPLLLDVASSTSNQITENPQEIVKTTTTQIELPSITNQKKGVCEEKCEHYPNGNSRYRGLFKNGKPHGQLILYYENGKMYSNGLYTDGLKEGEVQEFYENGKLKSRGLFSKGKEHGQVTHYFDNGNIQKDGLYSKGNKDGEVREYYENKKLKSRGLYTKGKMHGQILEYNSNGVLIKDGMYQEGQENGKVTFYNNNGKKISEGTYNKGKLVGQMITFEK